MSTQSQSFLSFCLEVKKREKNMAKKGGSKGPSSKVLKKEANQKFQDLTFGLKNKKKSKRIQKEIAHVKHQIDSKYKIGAAGAAKKGISLAAAQSAEAEAKKEKLRLEQMARLLRSTIVQPPLKEGQNPKDVLCEFFKHGMCTKGDRCKYSHDLDLEKKKRASLYVDKRIIKAAAEEEEEDAQGRGFKVNLPQSQKVCPHFLDAIEKGTFGRRWKCPNGDKCHFTHALPRGVTLRVADDDSKVKKTEKERWADMENLTKQIEELRKHIIGGTPVNPETFAKWKAERIEKRKREADEKEQALEKKRKSSKNKFARLLGLSGRSMFVIDESLLDDGDEDEGRDAFDQFERRKEEDEEEK
ncbi:hypothetical protein ADUPG1_014235 [Aduncisulcus paluster]|uniref:C3H1-type domain-containing protein n=1 Tax=Aduncisulcus paluster TaxID=2918883 RepID=A0ABQ5KEL6_9EUKA|nr:hypothetical protein ADUPG1_014235 [Aduncisulcus paluster]